jgi:hypothetical protein
LKEAIETAQSLEPENTGLKPGVNEIELISGSLPELDVTCF